MKESTRFYIILAISFIISVFVVPSPKMSSRELIAIDQMEKGKFHHSSDVSTLKVLQDKASGWGVVALTVVLTAVLFPLSSVFTGSGDDKDCDKSLSEITGKKEKPKIEEGETAGITGEIVEFFRKEMEARFKGVKIYKIFFEIGEYWDERDEECVDFHLAIAPNDESDEAGYYIIDDVDSDKNCIRYPGFSPLAAHGLEYSDAVKIAKDVVQQIKLNFDFTPFTLADDFKIFDLEQYD